MSSGDQVLKQLLQPVVEALDCELWGIELQMGGKTKLLRIFIDRDEVGVGIDDDAFLYIFKPIISKIMEIFNPGAVVLQCGADSLTGDRLGCFNVTLEGNQFILFFHSS